MAASEALRPLEPKGCRVPPFAEPMPGAYPGELFSESPGPPSLSSFASCPRNSGSDDHVVERRRGVEAGLAGHACSLSPGRSASELVNEGNNVPPSSGTSETARPLAGSGVER
jgi:hypothetical protein